MSPDDFQLQERVIVQGDGMGGHHSAAALRDEWLTPAYVIHALGNFDLDPCASKVRPWPTAYDHATIDDDGLMLKWYGRVWMNPPYGPKTGLWLEKLAKHGRGTALIFARTETQDWHTHVWPKASGILFLEGRLTFCHTSGRPADRNAGAPSALIAYGHSDALLLAQSTLKGHFINMARR